MSQTPVLQQLWGLGFEVFFFQLLGSFCSQKGAQGVGIGVSTSSSQEPRRTNALAFILGVLGQFHVGAVSLGMFFVSLGMFFVSLGVWGSGSEADAP